MSSNVGLLSNRPPRSAFTRLLETETKVAWRVPVGLVFGLVVPVLAVVILGSIPAVTRPSERLGGISYFSAYFTILITASLLIMTLVSLPTHLANYRETGILRRMSTTPVPPVWMLGAQVLINLAMAVVALGIILAVSIGAFGLAAPKQAAGFALALVLSIAATFAIGLWVSAVARTTAGAGVIGSLLLYPLLFFAGMWLPREAMAPALRQVDNFTPSGAAVRALQDSMAGAFPSWGTVLVLLAYAAVFGILAVRYFRWE